MEVAENTFNVGDNNNIKDKIKTTEPRNNPLIEREISLDWGILYMTDKNNYWLKCDNIVWLKGNKAQTAKRGVPFIIAWINLKSLIMDKQPNLLGVILN